MIFGVNSMFFHCLESPGDVLGPEKHFKFSHYKLLRPTQYLQKKVHARMGSFSGNVTVPPSGPTPEKKHHHVVTQQRARRLQKRRPSSSQDGGIIENEKAEPETTSHQHQQPQKVVRH